MSSTGNPGGASRRDLTGADPSVWTASVPAACRLVGSSPNGLSTREAADRYARLGRDAIVHGRRTDAISLLARQFASPIIVILVVATALSGLLGDFTDAVIILAIIVLSGLLGFWQERGAVRVVESLLATVRVKAEVLRDGSVVEVPVDRIVPGDVVLLNAGDVVPGDCLVLESRALLVDEAALTGETYPAEKQQGQVPGDQPIVRRSNALFLGTHVVSGTGRALVIATGRNTEFGRVSSRLERRPV
ncbi:MAG TPA: cation-transporting P-type ATPase, partial [Candidatus Limnocylindria bacterium]|nr:cation-transporting P-type ATPase [Candidatus Limnocylindria bacterium]